MTIKFTQSVGKAPGRTVLRDGELREELVPGDNNLIPRSLSFPGRDAYGTQGEA